MELTADQKHKVRAYLAQQGLSFKPLQDEMADHLICDIELLVLEGYSFDEAWHKVTGEISENHFERSHGNNQQTIYMVARVIVPCARTAFDKHVIQGA